MPTAQRQIGKTTLASRQRSSKTEAARSGAAGLPIGLAAPPHSSKGRRMLREHYPYYLANRAVAANRDLPVVDKFTGKVATHVALADEAAIDQAIAAAV